MPTDLSRADPLIDGLVADLDPVRPRRWQREAALLAGLALVEILLFIARHRRAARYAAGDGRDAVLVEIGQPGCARRMLSAAAVLVSLDPATSTARRLTPLWRALAVAVPVLLAAGWLIDAGAAGRACADRPARLARRGGLPAECRHPVAATGHRARPADAARCLDPAGADGAGGRACRRRASAPLSLPSTVRTTTRFMSPSGTAARWSWSPAFRACCFRV